MSKFQFKQFEIEQDRCAMKVGTDGLLFGVWTILLASLISEGTGLIALMLAQRSQAEQIDAIEIENHVYEQANENFENSPWNERLYCYKAGFDEFVDEVEELLDVIVSNPPFYTDEYKSDNEQRDLARFEEALPFEELVEAADFFLSDHGISSIIIPFKEEGRFVSLCSESGLFPLKITRVKGIPTSEIKRSLLAFSRICVLPFF